MRRISRRKAIVGVADHCGWAVLVTVASDGSLLDRRRVELVDGDLPKLPHHHEAQRLPVKEGVALVARVRRSAEACAVACLESLANEVPAKVVGITMRVCPPLPADVATRISDYQAQTRADSVMYRQALAAAARARGWEVHWYEAKRVLERKGVDDLLERTGAALGPPWNKDHKLAMAASLAALLRAPKLS